MNKLYPLKFQPIYRTKVWGGHRIKETFGRAKTEMDNQPIGESWEVSGFENNATIISNGFLADNDLAEITEIYMEELVGDKVFQTFGKEFPLLVKFIDSNDALSVQVHPHHQTDDQGKLIQFGKNEMWYVMDADPQASLTIGFQADTDAIEVLNAIKNDTITKIIHTETVSPGDVFYIPTGRLHAIGKGMLICEIQQSCDTTYRLYDWGRNQSDRPLHISESLQVLDFKKQDSYKSEYNKTLNTLNTICKTPYFTTNYLKTNTDLQLDLSLRDSFTLLICLNGQGQLHYTSADSSSGGNGIEPFVMGDCILIPACIENINIQSDFNCTFLETHID